jgi:hypothetical protein
LEIELIIGLAKFLDVISGNMLFVRDPSFFDSLPERIDTRLQKNDEVRFGDLGVEETVKAFVEIEFFTGEV